MGEKLLDGKVVVLTGAANGIGRAAARTFSVEGARLLLADINGEELDRVVADIVNEGGEAKGLRVDVSDEDQVEKMVNCAIGEYSGIDVLCNNAGITGGIPDLEEQDTSEWKRIYDVNVMGAVFASKYASAYMKSRKKGSIVNTASVAGIRSGAGGFAYSASKAALINFTMGSACELGRYNVRVNAVCPGLIETNMTKPVFDYARQVGKEEKLGSRCELRRYGDPGEVARVMLFLSSDMSSYVTGQALAVDGGLSASLGLPGQKV